MLHDVAVEDVPESVAGMHGSARRQVELRDYPRHLSRERLYRVLASGTVDRAPASVGDTVFINSTASPTRAIGAIWTEAVAVSTSRYRRSRSTRVAVPTTYAAGGATDEWGATGYGSVGGTGISAPPLTADTSRCAAVSVTSHRKLRRAAPGSVACGIRRTTESPLSTFEGEVSRASSRWECRRGCRRIRHARRCPMVAVGAPAWTEDGSTSFRCWWLRPL